VVGALAQFASGGLSFYGPFLYQNGSYQQTGFVQSFPPVTSISSAGYAPFGITNSGQVVGATFIGTVQYLSFDSGQGFVVPVAGGQPTMLTAPGNQYTAAFGQSANGSWVAGAAVPGGQGSYFGPFLWHNGSAQALPKPAGYLSSYALGVNDSGMAAGQAYSDANSNNPPTIAHAVLFNDGVVTDNGAVIDLGVLPGDQASFLTGINDAGQMVGISTNQPPTTMLGFVSVAQLPTSAYRAFVYSGGAMYDLNKLMVNGTGWQISYAVGINNAGQIAGTGLYQGQPAAFLLTPVAAPQIASVAGAGLSVPAVTTLSPNGLFSIFGSGFASAGVSRALGPADMVNNALPTSLAGVCVESGSSRWGVTYVSPTQVNALAGALPSSGTAPVSVVTNCGTANQVASVAFNAPVAAVAPEFLYFVENSNGQNPVAAIENSNGAYVGPPGLIAGATFAPAQANDVLTVFAVGLGATVPEVAIGAEAPGAASVAAAYTLTVGGLSAQVLYAGVTPNFTGLYQIDFYVPAGLAAGKQPIVLTEAGVSTSAGAYLMVGQ